MPDQNLNTPVAFLSYARFNDLHDEERITELRKKLAGEVQTVTADEFNIFQDTQDVRVGQKWKERIDETISSTTLLIAILSPSFFKSEYCRQELAKFFEREKELERSDLIIPIYYVAVPGFEKDQAHSDELIEALKARQRYDWTSLRLKKTDSEEWFQAVHELALQIQDALDRFPRTQTATPPPASRTNHSTEPQSSPAPEPITQTDRNSQKTAPTEPPTYFVDFLRGPHRTLVEAVSAASPGDRIFVRPGTYDGGVTVDKPLEIVGESGSGEIVVQASGTNALAFRTTLGRIANITLRQLGGGNYFAVDIVQGGLTIEGCRVESVSLAGIAVHGAEAQPIIRNNCIMQCAKSGVIFFDGARGTLEGNDIYDNQAFGVVIRDGADPVLRSNKIRNNELGGVNIDGGTGRLEDNTISSNRGEGVLIANGANPVIQRNKVFSNERAGIYVYDRGGSTVKENQIFENRQSGIAIRNEGAPVIQENQIKGNNGKGVWCADRAAGVVENNDLRENGFGAFWKSPDSTTRYVANQE